MKIALLTDGIHPYVIGGMQKHSYYLAKYFAESEVQIDLFHFNQSSHNIDRLECFSANEKQYINSVVIPFPKLDKLPGHYIRESYRYSELIFEKMKNQLVTYDFIYAKGFTGWKLIEEKKNGLMCPPIGVKFHGYEMFQKPPSFVARLQHSLLKGPTRWISKNADFVFSYGGKITDIVLGLNVSAKKIIEIPTGIENEWLNNQALTVNPRRKFVFVGRYERRKGIEELNKVLKDLIIHQNFLFEFVGPIPLEKQLKSTKIVYHGAIGDSKLLRKILQPADVLVCPSHSEGMPNVILEGMASGLAIIATNVGAVSEMVDKNNGILIEPNNESQLSEAIINLLNLSNVELLGLKSVSLSRVSDRFLWENQIKTVILQIKNNFPQR